jgi:hypothetical protein
MKRLNVRNIAIATLCATMAFGTASAMADGQADGITVKFVNTSGESLDTIEFSNG